MVAIVQQDSGSDGYLTRQLSMYLCHKYCGKRLKEIGKHFGISKFVVTQASRHAESKISNDKRLRKKINKIRNKLIMSIVYGLLPKWVFKMMFEESAPSIFIAN